jgi:hypothetical protein
LLLALRELKFPFKKHCNPSWTHLKQEWQRVKSMCSKFKEKKDNSMIRILGMFMLVESSRKRFLIFPP